MIITGHQSAYLPWLGLLHKASLGDVFIYMDDVQFLDRDFNHRNRVVTPSGQVLWLTVPINRSESRSLLLKDIIIKQDVSKDSWQIKHWLTIKSCYGKAPFFKEYAPFFEWLYLENQWSSLSQLNLVVLKKFFSWFGISAKIEIASEHHFTKRKSELILEHCEKFMADTVITGMYGKEYICLADFQAKKIKVLFQNYRHPEYIQRCRGFTSNLSAIDLLFNCGDDSRSVLLHENLLKEDL